MPEAPTLPQLEQRVLDLVRDEVLQTPPGFGTGSDLFEAGLDSMAIMQLLLLLEEHYGVAIPVGSVSRANFKSAKTIAALLVQQGFAVAEGGVEPDAEAPDTAATPEPASLPPAPPPAPPVPEAKMDRLPLRDCDFFTHAFDEMLRHAGQGGHIARSFIELDRAPDVVALKSLLTRLQDQFAFPILTAQLKKKGFFSLHEWVPASHPRPLELNLWSDEKSPGHLQTHGAAKFADLQTKLDDIIN
ncbi:MAG TPA: phosphopantetheine-binding protein, partial [Prosthecobacter sp.]